MREMVQHTRVAPAARIERLVKFIVGGSQIPYVHSQEVTRIKDAFKTNYAPKKTSKTISFIMLLVCFVGYVNAEDQEKKNCHACRWMFRWADCSGPETVGDCLWLMIPVAIMVAYTLLRPCLRAIDVIQENKKAKRENAAEEAAEMAAKISEYRNQENEYNGNKKKQIQKEWKKAREGK